VGAIVSGIEIYRRRRHMFIFLSITGLLASMVAWDELKDTSSQPEKA
jgi:hypothetical protein